MKENEGMRVVVMNDSGYDMRLASEVGRLVAAIRYLSPETVDKFISEYRFQKGVVLRTRSFFVPEMALKRWKIASSEEPMERLGTFVCAVIDKLLYIMDDEEQTGFGVELRKYRRALLALALVHCHDSGFGGYLRKYRQELGMTQAKMGKDVVKCSQRTLSTIENNMIVGASWEGDHNPFVVNIRAWATEKDLGSDLDKRLDDEIKAEDSRNEHELSRAATENMHRKFQRSILTGSDGLNQERFEGKTLLEEVSGTFSVLMERFPVERRVDPHANDIEVFLPNGVKVVGRASFVAEFVRETFVVGDFDIVRSTSTVEEAPVDGEKIASCFGNYVEGNKDCSRCSIEEACMGKSGYSSSIG